MFDHVGPRVADPEASVPFYRRVLAALGAEPTAANAAGDLEWGDFCVAPADAHHPPTHGLRIGLVAPSAAHVEVFDVAGGAGDGVQRDADGTARAVLRAPEGTVVEAVFRPGPRRPGTVDHCVLVVADHDAAVAFYALAGRHAGFAAEPDAAGPCTTFRNTSGSLTVVADGGAPTTGLHLAFPAPAAAVRAWHAEAVAHGFRDNGAPGPRPQYGAGYYGAFVLDPDGTNAELVTHGGG